MLKYALVLRIFLNGSNGKERRKLTKLFPTSLPSSVVLPLPLLLLYVFALLPPSQRFYLFLFSFPLSLCFSIFQAKPRTAFNILHFIEIKVQWNSATLALCTYVFCNSQTGSSCCYCLPKMAKWTLIKRNLWARFAHLFCVVAVSFQQVLYLCTFFFLRTLHGLKPNEPICFVCF